MFWILSTVLIFILNVVLCLLNVQVPHVDHYIICVLVVGFDAP
jgi:hypothetical protein